MADASLGSEQVVGGRPAGCPRSYCGCGASIRVFGRIVPGLNLASNWLRFPRAAPAPGMVAARHGHVFVLEQHVEGDTWMAYDANSGGHATRVHARSLRGYTVVNPHSAYWDFSNAVVQSAAALTGGDFRTAQYCGVARPGSTAKVRPKFLRF